MAAADTTLRSQSFRFIGRLKQFAGGFARSGRKQPPSPSTTIDLGDLAVAQLVHDLRNQLTIMLVSADNLGDVVLTGEADLEIAELRQSAERSLRLASELLRAARPRAAARRPVDLNHVVSSAAEMLSPVTADRIHLQLRLSPVPVPVAAELSELERILLNLALNACEAIAGDGVLTIETAVMDDQSNGRIEGVPSRPHARLTVTDTGCGMTPEVEARIFDPYFSTKEMGTGLGLSSVALTVRELKGTVVVKSQPGRGTSFSVILPVAIGLCR